jgi:hypothetical protein
MSNSKGCTNYTPIILCNLKNLKELETKLKGVEFDDAFSQAQIFNDEGLEIRFIHLNNLIEAKKAAGRHKDLDDIEKLTGGE